MAVTKIKTLPSAVAAKMRVVVGTLPADADHVETLRASLARHPELVLFFQCCRWGSDGDDHLCFDNIPSEPNTSTKAGWHVAAATALGNTLGLTPAITANPLAVTFS